MASLLRRDWREWYNDKQYRKKRAAHSRRFQAEDPPRTMPATVTHHVLLLERVAEEYDQRVQVLVQEAVPEAMRSRAGS